MANKQERPEEIEGYTLTEHVYYTVGDKQFSHRQHAHQYIRDQKLRARLERDQLFTDMQIDYLMANRNEIFCIWWD